MSIVKQLLATAAILAASFWGLVNYVPASLPILDRFGLLEPFGIVMPETVAEAGSGPRGAGGPGRGGAVAVVAMTAGEANLFDEITTIGDGRALRTVALLPEVAGNLSAVNVQSGQYVNAGDVVATLDDKIQRLELDRAQFLVQDAQATADRVNALGATIPQIQRSDANLALQIARLDLEEAQFELERRRIVAPVSGWVGIIGLNVGDQVTPSTEITQIDDRSEIVVEFRVPERFVGQIALGDTIRATPLARPQLELEGRIVALDNRVDSNSRTLRLQASLENVGDVLRAGMAFRISLSFIGEAYPSVDPLAIQWNSDGPFVWVIREGKAARQKIAIVQRNSDSVLVSGDLAVGEQVVTEGVQNLRPGAEVEIRSGDAAMQSQAALPVSRG
ncbi:efflux RND transporter periplasmic adaptor subunit [Thetidibacter halocola]|uniref:Efflux RND transporter periplasmic adaptor subunit n=1 Tax=Thetidibacter halocola TaxID=2827239 RepID=A0A8J8B9A6_9RHOB|nr:efflux RND transporter periplasmic adaptor subunit [Thetidibacter halocola]MBS0125674.1 efflux RND transporter periplasmic adaptor subunit [Thetidibacter halocola]